MADLDDFFAKKDRKKNRSSKKFSTTEEVAKKLDETAKKTEKQKKERVPEGDENASQVTDQDEWKEFEEEKKDYSGLKIGNLTINADQDNSSGNQETGSGDQQDGNELGHDSEKKSGPWNRMGAQAETVAVEEPPPKPTVEKKSEAPASAYVPPSMRSVYKTQVTSRTWSGKGSAPDIHNEDFFPTLSKSNELKKNRNESSFEMVQSNRAASYRQQMEQSRSASGPNLKLGNRYNTLSNDS
ncbi:protein CDV3 homolog [Rhynchophorus ferrugineus]|uniref:Protein CDV3 homolog n=1 Tax=Rhynchophorus ferrugineus TaxID=354439 RepID=A0A834I0U3_RHYFE|nr:hypothetical protein GWI33_016479 [Rhynchophorus ferrugineus]